MTDTQHLGRRLPALEVEMSDTPARRNRMFAAPPEMILDADAEYHAVMVTAKGSVTLRLFAAETPKTTNNFVYLALCGFYDGTMFHRVIENFMAQGGDPSGTGTGGPGYQFEDEFHASLRFDRPGLLAMANAGPGTNGSQFFITFVPTAWLDRKHTIFGEVVAGMDAVNALQIRDPQRARSPGDLIERIEIYSTAAPQADA